MIIQILADLREQGYLTSGDHPMLAPFFAGANVAFRRSAVQQTSGFDPQCVTGEDCDMCARLQENDWALYLQPEAVVAHNNPTTLSRLVRQWFGYGLYHPYVFAKHNDRAVELYVRLKQPLRAERYTCLYYARSPLAIVVFFTRWLAIQMLLLGALMLGLLGYPLASAVLVAVGLWQIIAYAWPDVRQFGVGLGLAFAALRYAADASLFVGAFFGGLRQRMLYLSATVD
jgi:cellulose synthase/poly-beta-1,6-N-acetylglucosamine synthase-like glycosyltransferase